MSEDERPRGGGSPRALPPAPEELAALTLEDGSRMFRKKVRTIRKPKSGLFLLIWFFRHHFLRPFEKIASIDWKGCKT
jgi:hypothetical protein